MPEPSFYLKQGDTASVIEDVLQDENGDPVDIASATIRFHMAPIQGGSPVVEGSATNLQVTDGTGHVSYAWGTADTDTSGLYLAEWEVTFSGGKVQSFPNGAYALVRITPELA